MTALGADDVHASVLPVTDISGLGGDGAARQSVVARLREAALDTGFFLLIAPWRAARADPARIPFIMLNFFAALASAFTAPNALVSRASRDASAIGRPGGYSQGNGIAKMPDRMAQAALRQ
jgi:hypothetical protein